MAKLAIWVVVDSKPGKEREVEEFLKSAQRLAEKEAVTLTWYARENSPFEVRYFRHVCYREWPRSSPDRRNRQGADGESTGAVRQRSRDLQDRVLAAKAHLADSHKQSPNS